MKHRTAKFIDWIILKPILFYSTMLIPYGIFFSKGSWIHSLLGIVGVVITGMIGQSLYPKSTPSDLSSGRACDEIGPDNEEQAQSINVEMKQIKIRHDKNDY